MTSKHCGLLAAYQGRESYRRDSVQAAKCRLAAAALRNTPAGVAPRPLFTRKRVCGIRKAVQPLTAARPYRHGNITTLLLVSKHCGLPDRSALFINIFYMSLNIKLSTCSYYIDSDYCFHLIESLNLMK